MTINYNVTGPSRKELAAAVGVVLGVKPKYLGMPTAAYEIAGFTVTRDGTLQSADSEQVETVLAALADAGFVCESQNGENAEVEESSEPGESGAQAATEGLTVAIPLEKVAVNSLTKLLDAKGSLIKKALGIDQLPIEVGQDRVSFPWFPKMPDADEVRACTHFISALCEMAKNAKRVTATEKEVGNEKYAFRCFLLRLGFIGAEYKSERKILLRNLSGSSAFKNGGASHEVSE